MGTNESYNLRQPDLLPGGGIQVRRRVELRWDAFEDNIKVTLKDMREESEFFDVTLVAGDGKQVKANKVILAGGSSFFFNILKENPHPYPLIYLRGVSYDQLKSVLDFIYTGQASIVQEDLNQFLVIAEDLKIKGLFLTEQQTKADRSVKTPLQSQGDAEERPPSLQEKEAVQECSPSTRIMHPHSRISTHKAVHSPSGIFPQATYKQYNENTSDVKVELLDAEHDSDSYKMNENDNPNRRRSSMLVKNEGGNESKKNVKILGSNYIKEIGRTIYGLSEENQGMDSNYYMGSKEEANNVVLNEQGELYNEGVDVNDDEEGGENLTDQFSTMMHKRKVCSVCGQSARDNYALNVHMRIHTGEKPFPCLYCSKTFSTSNLLKRHTASHTTDKVYV